LREQRALFGVDLCAFEIEGQRLVRFDEPTRAL